MAAILSQPQCGDIVNIKFVAYSTQWFNSDKNETQQIKSYNQ